MRVSAWRRRRSNLLNDSETIGFWFSALKLYMMTSFLNDPQGLLFGLGETSSRVRFPCESDGGKGSFIKHVIVEKRRAPSAKCLVQHRGALRGKLVERIRFAHMLVPRECSLRSPSLPILALYPLLRGSEASIQWQ